MKVGDWVTLRGELGAWIVCDVSGTTAVGLGGVCNAFIWVDRGTPLRAAPDPCDDEKRIRRLVADRWRQRGYAIPGRPSWMDPE